VKTNVAFILAVTTLAFLAIVPEAAARGGHYRFEGGTAAERKQVVDALNVSAFNWSVVPWTVTIHIRSGSWSSGTAEFDGYAAPRHIYFAAKLLDEPGRYSWGYVQHEYAHQVDFARFNDATRKRLNYLLVGKTWSWHPGMSHGAAGAERFASTLAFTYWPSPDNLLDTWAQNEARAMLPGPFKKLMRSLVGCC
jgi:hypothetical protein